MGPHGICVHPAPRGRDYVEAVDVDVALFTRDDIVRAVLAQQWAEAIVCWAPLYAWAVDTGSSCPEDEALYFMQRPGPLRPMYRALQNQPCAERLVAEMLGEVQQ